MGNYWDKFAEKDAEYYILTTNTDYTTQKGREYFFESGEVFTAETIADVSNLLTAKERALEIGCGIGRLPLPHSAVFEEVVAVNLSSIMLDRLYKNAIEFEKNNIETFLPSERWDNYLFDYAYSFIVFQHIEDFTTIRNYISRISNSLKKDGIAQLQFDTRSSNLFYKIRNLLPDFLLPKNQRTGIRRIRRKPKILEELFSEYNFEIVNQLFQKSERHTYILRKN